MKLKLWDRILAAFTGLIILLMGIALFVFSVSIFPVQVDLSVLNGPFTVWQRVGMIAAATVMVLLGLHGLWLLFHRRNDKGFIMQHTELGDMSISMNALETMVHKCVDQHQELTVKSTRIYKVKTGIAVEIRIILENGINIPLTVNALQKQIKQYITSCSGVDVCEVRVLVETNIARKSGKDLVVDVKKPEALQPMEPIYATPATEKTENPVEQRESVFQEPIGPTETVTEPVIAVETPTVEETQEMPTEEQSASEQPFENPDIAQESVEEDEVNGTAE
ncbi:MAG: alkaline shock response membrane anchor protein AmaP [Eubacteriales bacterium]|nr:alkaline shock response membrane anchor protein AmaP [Eubacteriales bacterium]